MENQQMSMDLKNTSKINNSKKNKGLFLQGFILRRVSKFITGGPSDGVLPIPVYYCPISNKILEESIPVDIREDYKDEIISMK